MNRLLIDRRSANSGFTLIEALVVILIISVLAAIVTPSWLAFQRRAELNQAQDRVYWVFKSAQEEAKLKKTSWQASFRMQGRNLEYAIHDVNVTPQPRDWQTISPRVQIDNTETTLVGSGGIYKMKFDYQGNVDTRLGRITIIPLESAPGKQGIKRCVFASTLIGSVRTAKENPKKDDTGRYCY